MVKRRLIDGMKGSVEDVQARQREIRLIEQRLEPKGRRKVREEEKQDAPQAPGRDPPGNPGHGGPSSSSRSTS